MDTLPKKFEKRANTIAAEQPPQLLWLWGTLGLQAYVEDHIECFMCTDRTDAHCPGVEAASSILALAEEYGVPKEEL